MTRKISPDFLRHSIVLIIFLQSFLFFSQNVNVKITVSWPSWSSENKIELLDLNGSILASIDNGYNGSGNGPFDNLGSPSITSVSINDNNPANSGYSIKIYDSYGDGWNSNGYATINVDGVDVLTVNDNNFDNIPGSGGVISKRIYFAANQVVVLDDASFTYSKTGYCQSESDPTPTITGESGGTFSSTSGLSINSSSGIIDVSGSTLGNYVVTYTTTTPNQNSSTVNVTISDGDVATFEYVTNKASQSSGDLSPTTTGINGGYSATSGLSINSSTGIIDVSASTIGIYTVSYTTTGSCPKVYTDEVEILASFPGVSQYYNASKKYIEYIPGTMPVIISAPHGGTLTGSELATRGCGTGEMDDNTDILIREIQKKCYDQFGVYPYIIINNLRRNKLDPNRNQSVATCGNASADGYFNAYHNYIDQASIDVNSKFGKGLYIDLHGQSHSIPRIEAGYNLPASSYDENLNNTATNTAELARVTIKNLIDNNLQNLTFEDLIRGSQSFGGLMQVTGGAEYASLGHAGCSRSAGYRTVPSHIGNGGQGSCDDTNPGSNSYFAGDYYSNIRHGSGSTSNGNSVVGGGGTVSGGGGTIDGIMTEVNRRVRDLGSAYSSTYGRTDGRSATVPYFSRDYARVIENFIDLHYNDFSNFSYSVNSYDIAGIDPTPTITGISGGTFSSTSGVSINSSTGKIDLSASTAGTYVISYIAANLDSYYKKEVTITITELVQVNEFVPSSGNWSVISNWSKNRLPSSTDNVSIPSGKTINLDLSDVSVVDVTVAGTLNINAGKSLKVTGNLNTTGGLRVNSDAISSGSLMVEGNSTGNIIYNRYIKDTSNWFMISSPLENQDIDTFISSNPIASGASNRRGLSNYNNLNAAWEYYINGSTNSGNFVLGHGRAVKITSAGNLVFTGDLKTDNVLTPVTLGQNGWNLIGNSFPSFLNVNSPADNTNNFIDINFSLLDTGFKAVYFWDTRTKSYKPFNNSSDATYVPPGQGFFIKVNANGNMHLNTNMQSHQSGDLFFKGNRANRFEINLIVSNGKSTKNTEVKYIKGTTKGLDDGYDAGLFGSENSFEVYTQLVANDNDIKYALQALPNADYSTMIIPIGVNAAKNSTLTFRTDVFNIPDNVNVYIEDKVEGTLHRVDEKYTSYKVTILEDLNSSGRFFIHTINKTLANDNTSISDDIHVYKNKNNLIIKGLNEAATIKLFSLIGTQVLNKKLTNKYVHQLEIPNLSKGVYFIKIETEKNKIQKKIVLE